MDRYFAIYVALFLEIALVVFCMLGVIVSKVYTYYSTLLVSNKRTKYHQFLEDLILDYNKPVIAHQFPRPIYPLTLLQVFEQFDRQFSDQRWAEIKEQMIPTTLLTKAERSTRSWRWEKRNFAARCFALLPRAENTQSIIRMIDDKVFHVRSRAARAGILLENREAFHKIIERMAPKKGFERCMYRDYLIEGTQRTIGWAQERLWTEQDPDIRFVLLDLLASRVTLVDIACFEEDFTSPNPDLRLGAVMVHSRNPQADSENYILRASHDSSDKVRTEAMKGLKLFPSEYTINTLSQHLDDVCWETKVEAATSLKEIGEPGVEILNRNRSTEVVRYVDDFC
ncbi:MAG: hypothetical protein S4CHLAM102_15860 [Chlamydiia bacterium]|nr:hypothetical protein [Chlamydiia bacterium]